MRGVRGGLIYFSPLFPLSGVGKAAKRVTTEDTEVTEAPIESSELPVPPVENDSWESFFALARWNPSSQYFR
jgi:hypothetical protein